MRRTFTRRNGEKLTIDLSIDYEKLAHDMARTLARKGGRQTKKASGSIVATIVEE